jgi:hypothetical protein
MLIEEDDDGKQIAGSKLEMVPREAFVFVHKP